MLVALHLLSKRCAWLLDVASELFCLQNTVCGPLRVITDVLSSVPSRRLPRVVCGLSLLLPQSLFRRLPQAAYGWDVVVLSPCACPPVRGTGAATLRAIFTW